MTEERRWRPCYSGQMPSHTLGTYWCRERRSLTCIVREKRKIRCRNSNCYSHCWSFILNLHKLILRLINYGEIVPTFHLCPIYWLRMCLGTLEEQMVVITSCFDSFPIYCVLRKRTLLQLQVGYCFSYSRITLVNIAIKVQGCFSLQINTKGLFVCLEHIGIDRNFRTWGILVLS